MAQSLPRTLWSILSRRPRPLSAVDPSGSSIDLVTIGEAERGRAEHGTEPTDGSPTAETGTVSIVLFGETGVGKSSIVNLIAGEVVAKVSSSVNACTMETSRYSILIDDKSFSIFDTVGLNEPQMGLKDYLNAIEKAYELISELRKAGGIHLLLFCLRAGRITATIQNNYRLFRECLCSGSVPIALIFTGLEREEKDMEDWWEREKDDILYKYRLDNVGHACITAVRDSAAPGQDVIDRYLQSQTKMRKLLKDCALQGGPFLQEKFPWFAKLVKGLSTFVQDKQAILPSENKDYLEVLMFRCGLDEDTAKRVIELMDRVDTKIAMLKEANTDAVTPIAESPGPQAQETTVHTSDSPVE